MGLHYMPLRMPLHEIKLLTYYLCLCACHESRVTLGPGSRSFTRISVRTTNDGPAATTTTRVDSDLYVMKHPCLSAANFLLARLAPAASICSLCMHKQKARERDLRLPLPHMRVRPLPLAAGSSRCVVHQSPGTKTTTTTYCAWRLPAWAQRHFRSTLLAGDDDASCMALPWRLAVQPESPAGRIVPPRASVHPSIDWKSVPHTHARRPRHARAPAAKGFFHICTLPRARTVTDLRYGWPAPDAVVATRVCYNTASLSSFFKKGGGESWTVTLCFYIYYLLCTTLSLLLK